MFLVGTWRTKINQVNKMVNPLSCYQSSVVPVRPTIGNKIS